MPFIVIWMIFCLVPAFIASNKGRNGVAFFFLSLFLSPVIGFIAAVLAGSVQKPQNIIVQQSMTMPTVAPTVHADHFQDDLASLERLGELKNKGVLSDAEFEHEKARVLHHNVPLSLNDGAVYEIGNIDR